MHQRDLSLSPARFPWPAEAKQNHGGRIEGKTTGAIAAKFSKQMERQPKTKERDACSKNTRCRRVLALSVRTRRSRQQPSNIGSEHSHNRTMQMIMVASPRRRALTPSGSKLESSRG